MFLYIAIKQVPVVLDFPRPRTIAESGGGGRGEVGGQTTSSIEDLSAC